MFDGVGAFLPWIAIPLAAMSIVVLWRRGIFRLEPTGRTCTRRHDSAYYFVLFVIAILAQMIAARSVSMVGDDADHDVPRDAAESASLLRRSRTTTSTSSDFDAASRLGSRRLS
jgi:hypothetical protein